MRLYWLLAFALASAITVPPALAQLGIIEHSPVPLGIGILIGAVPIVGAAVAAAREGEGRAYWRSLLRLPRPGWVAILALLLPPALLGLAYGIKLAAGSPFAVSLEGLGFYAVLWLVLAFGEEAGWRGFALPRLAERHGFWRGSLLLGIVWCAWHYPKLLGSPYLGSLAEALPLIALFSLQIIVANFIICWLYFRSGRSIVAPTLFHAAMNVMATAYFLAATDLVITALMAAVVIAIAIFDRDPLRPGVGTKNGGRGKD